MSSEHQPASSGQGAQTAGEGKATWRKSSRPQVRLDEYECSINKHAVTFTQLVQAHYGMRDPQISADLRQSCAYYYPELKVEFEKANGAIEELYLCRDIDAGAALTDRTRVPWDEKRSGGMEEVTGHERGKLTRAFQLWLQQRKRRREQDISIHLTYPSQKVASVTPPFQQALWHCFALSRMGDQLLRPESSRVLGRRAYAIVVNLLSVLDAQESTPSSTREQAKEQVDRIKSAIETTKDELVETKKQYIAAARWDSQYAYIKGMVRGFLWVALVLLICISLYLRDVFSFEEFPAIAAAWGLGAIGAMVSVMSRLASDRFNLNYQAEHQSLRMLGRFRPIIGAIFGSAVVVLITGGLLTIEEPSDPDINTLFFFAGLAFLAGFTERLAPDAFAASAKAVPVPLEQAEPAGAVLTEPQQIDPGPPPATPGTRTAVASPGKEAQKTASPASAMMSTQEGREGLSG